MCGHSYIGFIDFMMNNKELTDFTNLFSWNNFKKNDKKYLNNFNNSKLGFIYSSSVKPDFLDLMFEIH